MRQVPQNLKYLIIGSGRVSKHFTYYFSLLEIQTSHWNRKESLEKLKERSSEVTHVLVLISDDALNKFITEHSFLKTKNIIHFSGATTVEGTSSAHPLMTFSTNLYDLDTYKSIPFVPISMVSSNLPCSKYIALKSKEHLASKSSNFCCRIAPKIL